ncbi:hypothetical protein L9F63_019339, partial [Diploptera punctata]
RRLGNEVRFTRNDNFYCSVIAPATKSITHFILHARRSMGLKNQLVKSMCGSPREHVSQGEVRFLPFFSIHRWVLVPDLFLLM